MNKKFLGLTVFILAIVAIFVLTRDSKERLSAPLAENINNLEPVSLCYYDFKKTESGLYDKSWLRLNLSGEKGEKVSGEYNSYPAEKDSKSGSFAGVAGPLDQKMMGRLATLWWDTFGEGMQVKEELVVVFGEGSASIAYGEMVDRGDGVYVYKDKSKLTYGFSMSQIACEDLDEKLAVEKYIQTNIKTIATNQPVLGGAWYLVAINVVPATHSGEVTYEDGHIQSKASFEYEFEPSSKSVIVKKFTLKP